MKTETKPFDAAEYLDTDAARAAYLNEAFDTGDPAFITHALGVAAHAAGMTGVAGEAAVSRESLNRSLGPDGNPEFTTVLTVMGALGLKLAAVPATPKAPDKAS